MIDATTLLEVGAWWWSWFWTACIHVGAAIAMIGCLNRVAPSIPARFRSLLWRLAHLKLPLVLFWPAALSLTLPRLLPDASGAAGAAAAAAVTSAAQSTAGGGPAWLLLLGATIWCAGLAWHVVSFARGCHYARSIRHHARRCDDGALHRMALDLSAEIGCRRTPELLVVPGVVSPFLVGVRRPAIVLPPGAASLPGVRSLLAHELAHLRRRDIEWKLAEFLVRAVLWPLPLVWWARRESEIAAEEACDARALAVTRSSPLDYARLLFDLAAGAARIRTVGAVGATGEATALRRRFSALERRLAGSSRSRWIVAPALACALVVAAPFSHGGGAPDSAVHDSSAAAGTNAAQRIQLFRRDASGSSMKIVVTPGDPGLSAVIEHQGRPTARYRLDSLAELRSRDDAAYEFVQSSVRRTAERSWLFGAS